MSEKPVVQRTVLRRGAGTTELDAIATEEPLEIRVAGETVAITMRTPGDDALLAVGFLHSEGIIRSLEDVGAVSHCGHPGDEGYGNTIEVTPAPGADLDIERLQGMRRGTLTTSACGVCGRRSIDDLLALCGDIAKGLNVPSSLIAESVKQLRTGQALFARTGGTHAAGLFAPNGQAIAVHEDVGRHNAVDKVVGALLYQRRTSASAPALLAVSGRASFEIVQKAAMAGIPIVASVSAPSSLAVDLALRVGITLVGFVRQGAFNVYGHADRLSG